MQPARRKWIAALICVSLFLLILFNIGSSDDLLAKATRLAFTDGVVTNELTYSGYHYFYYHVPSFAWLSDARLQYIHEVRRGRYETIQMDLRAAKVAKQPGRGPLGQSEGMFDDTFFWRVSPDGNRILYTGKSGDDVVYTAMSLDGTGRMTWTNRHAGGIDPVWFSDSSGFVEWIMRDGTNCARVHWLKSGRVKEFDLDASAPATVRGRDRIGSPHAVVSWRMHLSDSAADVVEIKEGSHGPELGRFSVPLPPELGRSEGKVFLSPRGDRLAWLCYFKRRIPRFEHVSRFPFIRMEPRHTTSVLVSRLDGSGLRLIGRLKPNDEIGNLSWTPGGAHLSFVLDNAVWTVPVE